MGNSSSELLRGPAEQAANAVVDAGVACQRAAMLRFVSFFLEGVIGGRLE